MPKIIFFLLNIPDLSGVLDRILAVDKAVFLNHMAMS